jgi:hypothetical protein
VMKGKFCYEEVESGDEREDLRGACPESRTRGRGGADGCDVELGHDGGDECRR